MRNIANSDDDDASSMRKQKQQKEVPPVDENPDASPSATEEEEARLLQICEDEELAKKLTLQLRKEERDTLRKELAGLWKGEAKRRRLRNSISKNGSTFF